MGAQVVGHRSSSTLWRTATVVGVVASAGSAAVVVVLLARGAGQGALALASVLLALALVVLVAGLWSPRSVEADAAGLRVGRAVRTRAVPWQTVRRVRSNGQGMVQVDTHLELVDGTLVELPGGVPAGTVERWRQETGGGPAPAEDGEERSWPLARAALYWPAVLYLPLLLNVLLDGWPLVLALVVLAVGAVLVSRRPRPRVVATREGLSVPTWRGRRRVAWHDLARVRGRADRWDVLQTAERRDGTTVDLPVGLPADLVERWRDELHGPG